MSTPKTTRIEPTLEVIQDPQLRRQFIHQVMDEGKARSEERNARGLCCECDELLAPGERWCASHMRELEALKEAQQWERMAEEGVDLDDEDAVFEWLCNDKAEHAKEEP